MFVAFRIVNDVAYVMRINHDIHFAWIYGLKFLDSGRIIPY